MGANTGIEWTDATWTPVRAADMRNAKPGVSPAELAATVRAGWHCEHVSEGCRNCYAETMNARLGTGKPFKPGHHGIDVQTFLDEKLLLQPLRWKRPRRIFVCSMTDLFGRWVTDEMLDRVFALMALCPQHIFQVLTKRPDRMRAYVTAEGLRERIAAAVMVLHAGRTPPPTVYAGAITDRPDRVSPWPLSNVWLGTSVEDQAAADARIPQLLATPAAKRFLSCEPLLGSLTFRWAKWHDYKPDQAAGRSVGDLDGMRGIDWVIAGGESGPGARPMHPDWARSLRNQCAAAGVPFFFKQWGEWMPLTDRAPGDFIDHIPDDAATGTFRRGKKRAGRLLDGVTHDGMPE